ncbi:DUF3995 domain-containing protein [Spirillospora sp. CA-294931]|uniref:DUF3995 domain-containing protein n=1 Tax=Spirillospora sp. CA-294931 TaxID=3240042 RepID=UPI003D8ED4C9
MDIAQFSRPGRPWAPYAAATWGVVFSLVHVYWVLGGQAGLPADLDLFDNLPLLVIDVIAIPVSLVAAALAVGLVRPWAGRRLIKVGVWTTAALLIVHALPSVPDWVSLAAGTRAASDLSTNEHFVTFLYEPWFMVGGVLFALAARLNRL